MHKFHPRPDSPLYLSNEELVLGYLKFSAKGTKREIFGMPIPSRLITANIRAAPYYQEYQENVAKHRGFLAGETMSTQDLPAPRPSKPARKPQSTAQKAPTMPSISSSVTSTQLAPTSAEEVPAEEPQVAEEDADFQKAVEESMKDTYAHQWSSGNLSQENINLSQKCQERARLTRVSEPTASSFLDVSLYEVLGQLDSEEESEKVVLGV
nr:E-beta-farnesene synthase [Tanacetum cinerariifolium]